MLKELLLLIITAASTSQQNAYRGTSVQVIQSPFAKLNLNIVYRLCLSSAPAYVTVAAIPTDTSSTMRFEAKVIKIDIHEVLLELRRTDQDMGWDFTSITMKWVATMKTGLLNCNDIYNIGNTSNGIYTIYPNGNDPLKVYCDMTTQGGGWTVIMRRQNGNVDFNRSWANYTQGFGDKNGDFWLGLNHMYSLTSLRNVELRIDMTACDNVTFAAEYSSFFVGPASSNYKLSITGYAHQNGTRPICDHSNPQKLRKCGYNNFTLARCLDVPGCCFNGNLTKFKCYRSPDSMAVSNEMEFSTYDVDNDLSEVRNCAERARGGFWFRRCSRARLTSVYAPCQRPWYYAQWLDNLGTKGGLWYIDMKIRPR